MKCGFHLAVAVSLAILQSGYAAEHLPDHWWDGKKPEDVLRQAQDITTHLAFLVGTKSRRADDPERGFDYIQRRTANGVVESKFVTKKKGIPSFTEYSLLGGRYSHFGNLLLKEDYEHGPDAEKRVAATLGSGAYTYEMRSPARIGTNDCLVISRVMTERMFQARLADILRVNPTFPEAKKREYIASTSDFYIRKADGIVLGFLLRNTLGELCEDRLCDSVSDAARVPDSDITPPDQSRAVSVTSFDAFADTYVKEALRMDN
jgi:hypothetical protein